MTSCTLASRNLCFLVQLQSRLARLVPNALERTRAEAAFPMRAECWREREPPHGLCCAAAGDRNNCGGNMQRKSLVILSGLCLALASSAPSFAQSGGGAGGGGSSGGSSAGSAAGGTGAATGAGSGTSGSSSTAAPGASPIPGRTQDQSTVTGTGQAAPPRPVPSIGNNPNSSQQDTAPAARRTSPGVAPSPTNPTTTR